MLITKSLESKLEPVSNAASRFGMSYCAVGPALDSGYLKIYLRKNGNHSAYFDILAINFLHILLASFRTIRCEKKWLEFYFLMTHDLSICISQ